MIKMEKTCSSLRCDVLHEGKLVGSMEGVTVTKWFLKNNYRYTGTFSRYKTENPEMNHSGIEVDIIFKDRKIKAKDARIQWIRAPTGNGTFLAGDMEYCEG